MFARILVPLDGSSLAEKALPDTEELARAADVPVTLIQVIDLNHLDHFGLEEFVGAPPLAEQMAAAERGAREYLARIARDFEKRRVAATADVRFGDPARELVAAVQSGDLIVMSTHGRGGPARWFLGSVAEAVARHAPVPVMLIRAQPATPKA
jgi:nucleotide-binding universal stress UspA family protein